MPYDKKLHLAAGILIAFALGVIMPEAGLACALLAGVFKELFDLFDYGKFDWQDMMATWAGGIIGAIIAGAIK